MKAFKIATFFLTLGAILAIANLFVNFVQMGQNAAAALSVFFAVIAVVCEVLLLQPEKIVPVEEKEAIGD